MSSCFLILVGVISAEPTAYQPAFHEFQQQISALLKSEAQAKTLSSRAAAVRELCDLHGQIVRDSRYASSDVLKEYRSRLWSRLTKIKNELKQQLARQSGNKEVLDGFSAVETADGPTLAALDSLGASLSLVNETLGGPGQWMARGGGPLAPDWGPDLVDLIERTINPAFWDVAGGPGTIYYYRPLQCLVIRATSEVHGQIGGVVDNLRGAGR